MKISPLIQARMSSKRLPGKMLTKINKKPLLERVCFKISTFPLIPQPIVVTSLEKSDDLIHEWCHSNKIECFRGSLNDVYNRFVSAVKHYNLDGFIRICGDSPLIDPKLILKSLDLFKKSKVDIVSNVRKRTYPKGQSIEVISSKTFINEKPNIIKQNHREHITQYFYENSKKFKIIDLPFQSPSMKNLRMVVDNENDLKRIREIFQHPQYSDSLNYKEISSLIPKKEFI